MLTHRWRRCWNAQQAIIAPDDLAHNWLTAFRQVALKGMALQDFGVYRLIQETLNIPGEVIIEDSQLIECYGCSKRTITQKSWRRRSVAFGKAQHL